MVQIREPSDQGMTEELKDPYITSKERELEDDERKL